MIYLASPYFHNSVEVMKARYHEALLAAAFLLRAKKWNFSPISYCHEMSTRYGMPRDFEFWREYDMHMIRAATEFYILCIEGWDRSLGIMNERQLAEHRHLPITFMTPVQMDPSDLNAAYTFQLA